MPLAVSLVVKMRQTASNVTEAEFFLKNNFEALPVGMEELPTITLTEPTHILCTAAQHSPPFFLYHPCRNTRAEKACLWNSNEGQKHCSVCMFSYVFWHVAVIPTRLTRQVKLEEIRTAVSWKCFNNVWEEVWRYYDYDLRVKILI